MVLIVADFNLAAAVDVVLEKNGLKDGFSATCVAVTVCPALVTPCKIANGWLGFTSLPPWFSFLIQFKCPTAFLDVVLMWHFWWVYF